MSIPTPELEWHPNAYAPDPNQGQVAMFALRWKVGDVEFGVAQYAPSSLDEPNGHSEMVAIQACITKFVEWVNENA